MIKNYFKIALRNLWRHKIFSSLNIMGLAVGMANFKRTLQCLEIILKPHGAT